MLTYIIIFLVALLLIVGMLTARILYRKLHDGHFFHRLVTFRARRADRKLAERIQAGRKILSYFNKRTFYLFIHLVIELIEEYFHKGTRYVRSKFPHIK